MTLRRSDTQLRETSRAINVGELRNFDQNLNYDFSSIYILDFKIILFSRRYLLFICLREEVVQTTPSESQDSSKYEEISPAH